MRRFTLLGLALLALLAFTAALSASALALEEPENLPALKAGETRTWTGKNVGSTHFLTGGNEVLCVKALGEGTETTSKPPLGLFHIEFEECTSTVGGVKVNCTGLGDAVGNILALGTWHLVFDREVGKEFKELTTAVLFLNDAVHFTCSIVLVDVLPGETLCLHLKPTESNVTHEFHCLGNAKDEPIEEWSATDKGIFKLPVLLAGVNHPAKHSPILLLWLGTSTYKVAIFADQ